MENKIPIFQGIILTSTPIQRIIREGKTSGYVALINSLKNTCFLFKRLKKKIKPWGFMQQANSSRQKDLPDWQAVERTQTTVQHDAP
jgi:hypothetical protein